MHKTLLILALSLCFVGSMSAQETSDPECAEGTTAVTHDLGSTCVPTNAERVVALEWTYAEDLLALGIQPVGVADIENYNRWLKIEVSLDDTVVDVGTRNEPSLEVIASLNPDLILGPSFRMAENYDDLSAIAPTIAFNGYPEDITHYEEMIQTFQIIAVAVDREAEAEQVLEDMSDYFAQARAALADAGHEGEGFILSQAYMSNEIPTFRLFTNNALAVEILQQIGLVNDWDDAPQFYGFTTVDLEAFDTIGDTNFFYITDEAFNQHLSELPIWNSLPFVQSERAYWLGQDAWLFGGPLSAKTVVDTILDVMGVELPQAEATPEATEPAA